MQHLPVAAKAAPVRCCGTLDATMNNNNLEKNEYN